MKKKKIRVVTINLNLECMLCRLPKVFQENNSVWDFSNFCFDRKIQGGELQFCTKYDYFCISTYFVCNCFESNFNLYSGITHDEYNCKRRIYSLLVHFILSNIEHELCKFGKLFLQNSWIHVISLYYCLNPSTILKGL